jgi:hypothetical protein
MRKSCFTPLLILLVILSSTSPAQPQHPTRASLLQLIATPERFEGKLVSTTGFLSISREATFLYLDQESYTHHLDDNAVWFFLNEEMGKNRERLNHNYVVLVGVFRNQRKGAGTNPNGGFDPVQLCALVSTTDKQL